nr:ubiquitin-conjugating enzyme E2 E3 isoform X1 [Ovis aries]
MGSLAPEAGSGRKPPRGTAAPRDGARAPAFSAAKGGRGQSAGSPPRSLSGPRAGGRVRPPGEGRRGETARERAGTARARRPPAARAPPPGKQRARARAVAAPAPPPALASELADCAAGRSRAGRRRREATARGGLPRPLSLAGSSRPRPAGLPPPLFSEGAGRRHPPAGARHCTTPSDFQCSTLPGQSLLGFFFSLPPLSPPPAASISLRKGFFLSPSPTP